MKLDIFEGGRRLRTAVTFLGAVAICWVQWVDAPTPVVYYVVSEPGSAPARVEEDLCPSDALIDTQFGSVTRSGDSFVRKICFVRAYFPRGKLVPFKKDEYGSLWGDDDYSDAVRDYVSNVGAMISAAESDDEAVAEQFWPIVRKQVLVTIGIVCIWAALLYAVTRCLGWILSGFLRNQAQ